MSEQERKEQEEKEENEENEEKEEEEKDEVQQKNIKIHKNFYRKAWPVNQKKRKNRNWYTDNLHNSPKRPDLG